MRIFIALALIVASLPASLLAQAGPAGTANVEFRTMGVNTDISGIGFKIGERYTPINAKSNVISGSFRYTGPATMTLYRALAQSSNSGGASGQMPAVGSVQFLPPPGGAAATGRYLVVLMDAGNGQIAGAAMPESSSGFPLGSARVFNSSPLPITIHLNDKPYAMRGGEFKIVPLGDTRRLEVRAFMNYSGELTEVTNNVFSNAPTIRRTVILFVTNTLELRSSPDAPPRVQMIDYMDRGNQNSNRRGSTVQDNIGQ